MKRGIIGLCLCLWGCHGPSPNPSPSPSQTPNSFVLGVEAAQVVRQKLAPKLQVTGNVVPDRKVELASLASGRVEEVHGQVGERVVQGQTLVRLLPVQVERQVKVSQAQYMERAYQSGVLDNKGRLRRPQDVPNIAKAYNNLDYNKRHYESYLKLRKDELISDQQVTDAYRSYVDAKSDYASAVESYNQSVAQIKAGKVEVDVEASKAEDYIIQAPFDAFILERKVTVGAYANQGQPLGLVLVSSHPLFAELEVPQQFVGQLHLGQSVSVRCDANPGKALKAFVERMTPVANQTTRTLAVLARVEHPPSWLKPGMFVRAELQLERAKEQMLVPDAAVLTVRGKSQVFVLQRDDPQWKVSARPVKVGKSDRDWVEVQGLKPQDWVAASDLASLQEGTRVKISREVRYQP